LFAILGSFVVEGEVLAGWAFLDCWTFLLGWAGVSLAANRVPEKVHNKTPAINKLSHRNFIKFPPEALSGYFLPGLIIQKFRKITIKKRPPVLVFSFERAEGVQSSTQPWGIRLDQAPLHYIPLPASAVSKIPIANFI